MPIRKTVVLACAFLLLTGAASAQPDSSPAGTFLSVLPPLGAILLAIATRQVFLSLFLGLFLGAAIAAGDPLSGLARLLDTYLVRALGTERHASVVLFSLFLGAMVRIMASTGGLKALVSAIARRASTVRRGQTAAWLMGCVIFFDDYANTLLVGNTMRPFTDSLKVSREKLAYIVDSTAAPVASVMPVSTWIGYEVGLIGSAFAAASVSLDPYGAFLASIPYRFYGLLAVLFVLVVAVSDRDFSAMYRAEHRARTTGKVIADGARPLADTEDTPSAVPARARALDAVIPVLLVLGVTAGGLYLSGLNALKEKGIAPEGMALRRILGSADAFQALMWAAFTGSAAAFLLALRNLSLSRVTDEYLAGVKAMVPAMVILVLAWALSAVCEKLQTAQFCVQLAGGRIDPRLLPALIFLIAAFVSFATGTSWATMGILIPIAVPLAWRVTQECPSAEMIRLASIGAVLSGATFGDHCSPISDTTIMSSMASGCDHVDHVRTQIPYAFSVAAVSTMCGYLPAGFGLPPLVGLGAGLIVLIGLLFLAGRRPGG